MIDDQIAEKFGNKVRVRVCGLCWKDGKLLMVNHSGLNKGDFWSPPGGGVEFGQKMEDTLKSEFLEETGILVEPRQHLFTCELIRGPLHAVELFFEAKYVNGELRTGTDPELDDMSQIITEVRFMGINEIMALNPQSRHGIFERVTSPGEVKNLVGFYSI